MPSETRVSAAAQIRAAESDGGLWRSDIDSKSALESFAAASETAPSLLRRVFVCEDDVVVVVQDA